MNSDSETRKGYTLYFAYGSNMFGPQFDERCSSSFRICLARLPEYRFAITSSGYATVLKQAGNVWGVWGILCALSPADEAELDRREGVAQGDYRREIILVATQLGYCVPALVYIDNATGEGVPNPGYLEKVITGAQHHGLPEKAIAEIAAWAKSPTPLEQK